VVNMSFNDFRRFSGWTLLFFCVLFSSCQSDTENPSLESNSGTNEMKSIIDSIYRTMNPVFAMYDNKKRAEFLAQRLRESQSPGLIFDFAKEKLNAGETNDAIAIIENILDNNPRLKEVTSNSQIIHEFLGICYLRLAEQNNCLHHHSSESCIVPLRGDGIHTEKGPAERAKEIYSELHDFRPQDLEIRWLLNIAYMALGEYPGEVPDDVFISLPLSTELKSFPNIGGNLGVDVNDLSGSVVADDFTNNGYLDILASSWGRYGSIKLFVNKGEEGFKDRTAESGLDSVYGGLNIKQADFNNDGWMDFVVLRGAWKPGLDWGIPPNSLMMNNGDGTFSDVTLQSGVYSRRPTQSAVWLDYDLDGHIDLFIANETTKSSSSNFPCELFKNQGDGTFVNMAEDLNLDYVGYFKGVVSGDINNDGRPDLFLSNLDGNNVLLENRKQNGKVEFHDITQKAGVGFPQSAFPAWFFDYNQDGYEDIYVATFDSTAFKNQSGEFAASMLGIELNCEPHYLYENQGDGTFLNVAPEKFDFHALSTMGCNYGDITNSGFPDFYLGTGAPDYRAIVPNRLFVNGSGKRFYDATFATHTGHIQKGHGISFADFNHSGGQDVYAVMGGAFSGDVFHNALYENQQASGNWIKLKIEGEKSNAAALGAKIQVFGADVNGSPITRYSTVSSGASFGGNPTEAHMGLGKMSIIDSVIVSWPNEEQLIMKYTDLKVNQRYKLDEEGTSLLFPVRPFSYPEDAMPHHHNHPM